jgi:hypothetical protein
VVTIPHDVKLLPKSKQAKYVWMGLRSLFQSLHQFDEVSQLIVAAVAGYNLRDFIVGNEAITTLVFATIGRANTFQ